MVVFGQKLLNSGKVVAFGQGGCSRAKVHVIVQKYFYLGKIYSIRAKVVVFGQKWL